MTVGTIAVVAVLALVVGAIIYSWIKARRAGKTVQCSGCSGCSGCSESDDCTHSNSNTTP